MKIEMSKILCKIGLHRPLKDHQYNFTDIVSGKEVFIARCPCKKVWMVDSLFGFEGFKVEKKTVDESGSDTTATPYVIDIDK